MSNHLQKPFKDIVGNSSPVQKTIKIIKYIIEEKPLTKAKTKNSQSSSALVLTHLMGLMNSAGIVNMYGYHSSAITLLRAIEDATDCLAAVALDSESAIKWENGKLKASDAAKKWTSMSSIEFVDGDVAEYRKQIRSELNDYSHCTPKQTHWNIYLEKIADNRCTMELNNKPMVIPLNAYYIDQYLCIHIYEVCQILMVAYSDFFNVHSEIKDQLQKLNIEIENIIADFLKSIHADGLDISVAPEIKLSR